MFYKHGQHVALADLGLIEESALTKEAGLWSKAMQYAREKGLRKLLIGEPEQLIKNPIGLLREQLSLKPTRAALDKIRGLGPEGKGLWARTKGVGALGMDVSNKGFMVGVPGYTTYKVMTEGPAPGQTRGEQIGEAIGEGLGWLPPMGVLGTAASMVTPEYSLPGLTAWMGKKVGRGVSDMTGGRPAPPAPAQQQQQQPYEMQQQPQQGMDPRYATTSQGRYIP
jgi:hypothetical protein